MQLLSNFTPLAPSASAKCKEPWLLKQAWYRNYFPVALTLKFPAAPVGDSPQEMLGISEFICVWDEDILHAARNFKRRHMRGKWKRIPEDLGMRRKQAAILWPVTAFNCSKALQFFATGNVSILFWNWNNLTAWQKRDQCWFLRTACKKKLVIQGNDWNCLREPCDHHWNACPSQQVTISLSLKLCYLGRRECI